MVTFVEAKFGLRIRDSKASETGARGDSDPLEVEAVNSLASGKGKVSSSPRDGCFKCGGSHFQRDCNVQATPRRKGNGKKGSRGPRVLAKERARKVWETENPKENPKVPRVPKVRTMVKPRKLVYLVLKPRYQRQVQKHWNLQKRITLTLWMV